MGRLGILTRRRRSVRSTAVRWETVDATELGQHRDLVDRLQADELDGVTVQGVYPRAAAEQAARRLADLLPQATPVVFGTCLGRPLLQGGMSPDLTDHLDDAERMRGLYPELFGFDPHERLGSVLEPVLGGRPWTMPAVDGRPYNPGNIRHMEPGGGALPAHAGIGLLVNNADGSAKHLLATTWAREHMSYFVVLQRPDIGGQLSVFESIWEEPTPGEEVLPLRDNREFDPLPCLVIDADPGDLVLFNGGRRWHRVEENEGSIPRVTYGGFVAPSRDRQAWNCWA